MRIPWAKNNMKDQEEEEDEIQFRVRRIRFVYTNFSCCYTITQGGLFMYLPACMNYNRHVKFGIIWGDSECEWGNWRSPPKYKVREWSQSVRSSVTGNLVCTWRKKGGWWWIKSRACSTDRWIWVYYRDGRELLLLIDAIHFHPPARDCVQVKWWRSRRRWANSCMRGHRP